MRGKAAPADLRSDVDGDHPRTCGEKAMYEYGNNTAEGSPPHMRGKDAPWRAHSPFLRITPACAGKSLHRFRLRNLPVYHPRMCGEKSPLGPCGPVSPGSPPRMRGKGNLKIALVLGVGITPAHAGKRDSPRPDRPSAGGSPPHMRGKGVGAAFRAILGGITPAHAGKSKVMRGGKDKRMGSPPHMRGKGVNTGALPLYPWITPAHAGKSIRSMII